MFRPARSRSHNHDYLSLTYAAVIPGQLSSAISIEADLAPPKDAGTYLQIDSDPTATNNPFWEALIRLVYYTFNVRSSMHEKNILSGTFMHAVPRLCYKGSRVGINFCRSYLHTLGCKVGILCTLGPRVWMLQGQLLTPRVRIIISTLKRKLLR